MPVPVEQLPPLKYGTYGPIPVNVGDRLTDELRGEVVVGGFFDAAIPWPYATGPGPRQLVLTGHLARALRSESPEAVAAWWGVTISAAMRMRAKLENESAKRQRGVGTATPAASHVRQPVSRQPLSTY